MAGPYGIQSMLKEGHKFFSGVDEAVIKNIDACKGLSAITRTSLGPNGMNKMVINHLEKLFVTSDASTIVTELEVNHPAAKLLVMAAKAQAAEVGDGTNLVLSVAGELLGNAEGLLREGLHTAEIADGYHKALEKALEILETLVLPGSADLDVRDKAAVARRLRGAISSKVHGYEDLLTSLVAEACIDVCPSNPGNFNVDNVRIVKLMGGGLPDSKVVKGMVLRRDAEGSVKEVADGKVVVYAQGVDTSGTETKGTVLIKSAEELENYSRTEEAKLEEYIKAISDSGAKVVASGGAIGEMAMHFIEKYGMMALRIPSKFDMRRFCRATGATALTKLTAPGPDDLGYAKRIAVQEIGGINCAVLQQDASMGSVATVVLRGSTEGFLDDVERAVDDGVNAYKALCKDARMLAGGGAAEIEVARRLAEYGRKQTGLDQYAIAKFAEALEVVPRTLAENSGLQASDVVSSLYAAHAGGDANAGVDIEGGEPRDLTVEDGIMDLYATKWWALKLAADAVVTVLKVDQIIMAKQAGGPKPRGPGDDDD
ncbi:MAG: chaperonin complex component [Monoraphidium minutum]|nr:MAG: chaperonin complex component [Monoraphidium minutum]